MRSQMHAKDSDLLERRLGTAHRRDAFGFRPPLGVVIGAPRNSAMKRLAVSAWKVVGLTHCFGRTNRIVAGSTRSPPSSCLSSSRHQRSGTLGERCPCAGRGCVVKVRWFPSTIPSRGCWFCALAPMDPVILCRSA